MNSSGTRSMNKVIEFENGEKIGQEYPKSYNTSRYKRYLRKRDTVSKLSFRFCDTFN